MDYLTASFNGENVSKTIKIKNEIGHKCFIFNDVTGVTNESFYQNEVGKMSGLRISFFLKNSGANTIKVFVGGKGILPKYSEINKLFVEQAYIMDVALSKQVSTSLPKPYNNCYDNLDISNPFDSEMFRRTLANNHTYRQANCYDICSFKHVTEVCQCTANTIYVNNNYAKVECFSVLGSNQDCIARVLRQVNMTSLCADVCPLECSTDLFRFNSQTYEYDPDQSELREFRKKMIEANNTAVLNKDEKDFKRHLKERGIVLNIFLVDLHYEEISETPKMSGTDLISNIGGTMGNINFFIFSFIG